MMRKNTNLPMTGKNNFYVKYCDNIAFSLTYNQLNISNPDIILFFSCIVYSSVHTQEEIKVDWCSST